MKKTSKKMWLYSIFIIIGILIIAFFAWSMDYYKAEEETLAVFNNTDSKVVVEKDKYITFTPKISTDTGFIFYPGGKVEAEAYIPLCREIAEEGYKVVIVPMPLKLAVFGKNKAEEVKDTYPEIENWAIGGHSLGGVMAADYAYNNQEDIKALILYSSYPQDSNDFSSSDIMALSIWGTEDGVADIKKITDSKKLLPNDSVFKDIDGGNHCQFGNYGFQKGDKSAEISSTVQQRITAEYTADILEQISNKE